MSTGVERANEVVLGKITSCQGCGASALEPVLDLGHHAPCDSLLTEQMLGEPETHFPLVFCRCTNCGLAQLDYAAPPEVVFFPEYPYRTAMTGLLKEHIGLAVDLVKAAKGGDAAKIEAAKKKAADNGDQIATFLSGANPQNWPLDKMKAALKMHLDTTVQEATDRLAGKWDADVKDYDRVKEHIMKMADMLTDGIVAQHAKKFTG